MKKNPAALRLPYMGVLKRQDFLWIKVDWRKNANKLIPDDKAE